MKVNKWKIAMLTIIVWFGISVLSHLANEPGSYMKIDQVIFGMWSLFILILGVVLSIQMRRWILFLGSFLIYLWGSVMGAFMSIPFGNDAVGALFVYIPYTVWGFYRLEENRLKRKQKTITEDTTQHKS